MSNLKVSLILEAIDRMTAPIRNMASRVSAFAERMSAAFRRVGQAAVDMGKSINDIGKGMLTKLTLPIAGLGYASLKSAGSIETLNIKFESLLGSQEKALAVTKELTDFAAKTPFEMNGISEAAVKMLSAGVQTDKLIDRMTVLGDVSALAGADISEIATIYQRVLGSGVAYSMELEMLSDRGVPIWQELAKITGKSVGQIRKATANGMITFELFEKALESLRNEGGPAFQQMSKQSESFDGKLSTLGDTIQQGTARVGESAQVNLGLKNILDDVIARIESLTEWFVNLSPATQKWIFRIAIAIALLGPLAMIIGQLTMGIGMLFTGIGGLISGFTIIAGIIGLVAKSMVLLTLVTTRLSIAFMMTPFGWVTAAIAALAVAGYLIIKNWDNIKTAWSGIWDAITTRVQQAVAYIQPIIDSITSSINMIGNNSITRGISAAVNYVSDAGSAAVNYVSGTPQKVDAGGELKITIDQQGKAAASVVMNNPGIKTSVNQGVIMGGGL